MSDHQNQRVDSGSTAFQAGGNIDIRYGITYSEARQIALDVSKANLLQFAGEAADVAIKRVEKFTDQFLRQLEERFPEGLNQAKDPDFQNALFTGQKEYARCGDDELGGLLIDLLLDRTKQESRTILQIVLNESLLVAPKLTPDQIAILSTLFFTNYTVTNGLKSLDEFYALFDKHIKPYLGQISDNTTSYRHLEYTGCGKLTQPSTFVGPRYYDIPIFGQAYPGLFSKGFTLDELSALGLNFEPTNPLIKPCDNSPDKLQFDAITQEDLRKKLEPLHLPKEDEEKVIKLQIKHSIGSAEIKNKIIQNRPYMKDYYDLFNGQMGRFELTSVGIAIGHANIKKSVGEFTDLSIWIN